MYYDSSFACELMKCLNFILRSRPLRQNILALKHATFGFELKYPHNHDEQNV